MPTTLLKFFSVLVAGAVPLSAGGSAVAEMPPEGPRVALRMSSYPEYELRSMVPGKFDRRLLPLWLSALDSPERDLHRQVGDAIVRAKRVGMTGLDEKVAARLRDAFEKADHSVVRRSLARALIALDDRRAAEIFWEAGRRDYQLALIVEPVLGAWKHQPAVDAALERLKDPATAHPLLRLAMELLANAREEKARRPLLEFAETSSARGDLRLAAGAALGDIFSSGLVNEARGLSDRDRSQDPIASLIAVRLLANHQEAESILVLQNLARDPNTAVQGSALNRLLQIDPQLAAAFALEPDSAQAFSVLHPDANVRLAVIEALYSLSDARAIGVLRTFLDDPHPLNRSTAGDALFDLAGRNADFRTSVEEHLLEALGDSSWRTLECSAIVAGGLDFEAASDKLVPLLTHSRQEVAVASAWSLKELAVPETLPIVLERLKENLDTKYASHTKAGQAAYEIAQEQSRHLNEQLGLMKYTQAEPTLRRLIPQRPLIPQGDPNRQIHDAFVRATAMWSLGLIHEDKPNPELTALLMERMIAMNAMINPEPGIIGEGAAYAAGFMRDPSGLGTLQSFAARGGLERNPLDASAWAVERITGESLPLPEPFEAGLPRWFLRPAGNRDE
jgi:HEAT repeat protein